MFLYDEYEYVFEWDMEMLNESLEIFCEDFGNGNWEIEYFVCVFMVL